MGAAPISLWLPFAIHISDGVLRAPWLAVGFVVAGLLVLLAAYRVRDEEIPRIALLSAAFFVATLMHLPLGPTRVHLLLNGLVGVVLGRRAPLAIMMGLALQAVLLGHGGFTTIGVNACVMTLPALLAAALFAGLRRLPWFGPGASTLTWLCGCLLGMVSVLATLVLQAIVLLWGGAEDWHQIVWLVFYAHLPIVILEGVVVGFTVNFLAHVKPEMIGLPHEALRKWHRPSLDASEANGIVPSSTNLIGPASAEGQEIGSASPSPPIALVLAGLTLLMAANSARAHNACADFLLLPDRQVQIDGWYDPGDVPMKGAKVQVFRPGQRLLVEGRLDDNGSFVFRFTDAEPLEVIVNGGAGHRKSFVIPREKMESIPQTEPRPLGNGDEDRSLTVAAQKREHPDSWRERLKDALLGISFLLSLGAFLLSWRTSRRVRRREKES
jgi:cobalt/nickel transport system permease protein